MSSLSIKEQIAQLERQRAEELRRISDLYSRTQRDVARSVSPTRFVKKHLIAMLACAAVVGMVLAPAPRRSKSKKRDRSGRQERSGYLARLMSLALRWAPGVDKWMPGALKSKLRSDEAGGVEAPRQNYAEGAGRPPAAGCCQSESVRSGMQAEEGRGPKKRSVPDGLINEVARSVLTTFLARADIKGLAQQLVDQVKAGLRSPRRNQTMDATGGATIGVGDVGTVHEDETL